MLLDPVGLVRAFGTYSRQTVTRGVYGLTLELTRRCNARCSFCDHPTSPKQHELEDLTPVVERFRPFAVTLCGGEPLLRKDLARQIYAMRRLPGWRYLLLITNGSQLTVERGLELHGAGLHQLNVSLDYPDARHDEARGLKGLFDHLRGIVPALARAGVRVELNTVMMRDNLAELVPIAELARSWGATVTYTLISALPTRDPGQSVVDPAALQRAVAGLGA
jgi:molybdenum cofactor biosynthesis enzyme MoaA